MNKSYLGEPIRVPIRIETGGGESILGITGSMLVVNFSFETDAVFDLLTVTTEYTLEELSVGQYFLIINKTLNTKVENYQVDINGSTCCASIATKRYSGTVLPKVWENNAVHIKAGGTNSAVYPVGTRSKPCLTIANMKSIITATPAPNISKVVLHSDITFASDLSGAPRVLFTSELPIRLVYLPAVTFNGKLIQGCTFQFLRLIGISGENHIDLFDCILSDDVSTESDLVERCIMEGAFKPSMSTTAVTKLIDCKFHFNNGELDCSGIGTNEIHIFGGEGKINVTGMTTAGKVKVYGFDGEVIGAASCTNGTIDVYECGGVVTNSVTGTCVFTQKGKKYNVTAIYSNIEEVKAAAVAGIADFRAVVAGLALDSTVAKEATLSTVGGLVVGIDAKTAKLTFNATDQLLTDLRRVNDVIITLAELAGLTRAQYVDFFNKAVQDRDGAEPSEYDIGTSGNKETINVTHTTIGSVKKADTESVV